MRRRVFLFTAGGVLLAPGAMAQPVSKPRRIGVIGLPPLAAAREVLGAFQQALQQRGYVDGKNVLIEYRSMQKSQAAADFAREKVDLILCWATPPTLATRKATSTIPVVAVGVADFVAVGLADSLARPGGNVTGITNFSVDLSVKQLEMLRDLILDVRQIGVIHTSTNPAVGLQLKQTQQAVDSLHWRMVAIEARTPAEFEQAFQRLNGDRIKAVVMLPYPELIEHSAAIAQAALRARLLTLFQRRENVHAGGLLSYGPNLADQFAQAADYVDRIFQGAKPAEMPIAQPTRLELVINLKTANALGVRIPQPLLARADKLIQ